MDDRQTPAAFVWPSEWLMTDARLGEALWEILERMPADSGVVLRDLAMADAVARICRKRGLILAVSRDTALAERLGAPLVHNPIRPTTRSFSRSVHNETEALQAKADGAALMFVSPVFPTRSHPGAASLGIDESQRLAALAGIPAIALGGMDRARFRALRSCGFHGWAGIDAWAEPDAGQNLNAVPT